MILDLSKNIKMSCFDNASDLRKEIIQLIATDKAKHILYKGDPREVECRVMKRITSAKSIESAKKIYESSLANVSSPYCIIYKTGRLIS